MSHRTLRLVRIGSAVVGGIWLGLATWGVAQELPIPGRAGVYPLREVLDRSFVPATTASMSSPAESSAKEIPRGFADPDPSLEPKPPPQTPLGTTRGISPEYWGTNGQDLLDNYEIPAGSENWQDPPASEPEPTPYELRMQEKKRSPSLPEILNKGRYFGAAELLLMKPRFLGSTALTRTTGTAITAVPFEFDYSFAPRLNAGFESEQGPGIEFEYWYFNDRSNAARMTSNGATVGQTSVYLLGPERWTRLNAVAAGETLAVEHVLKAQSFDAVAFKELEFKISRLNGFLGLHYATLSHQLEARVTDAASALVGQLTALSEFEGVGPTIGIEYLRPVGHTKLEMLGGIKISILFGERDQLVQNSANLDFNRFEADELLSGLDGHLGVQYMHHLTEHRTVFARTSLEAQHWIGGGTATDITSDFGVYGWTFGVGLNR